MRHNYPTDGFNRRKFEIHLKTSIKILYPIFLSLALLAGICIGIFFDFPAKTLALSETESRENKLRQIINYIDYEYVDEMNTDSLLDLTITNLLRKLDPHSTYIPLEQVAANEESVRGSFEGVGIEFKIYKDTLTVIRVIENGPSEKAGIKAGDRILMAGDTELFGDDLTTTKIVNTLKGKSGSRVNLSVYHPMEKDTELLTIKRGNIPLKSVQSSFILNDKTGYIKLIRFSQNASEEISKAIYDLKKQGAKQLILDLRDNPGGLLSVAESVADEFLEDDELIVFTKDREGDKRTIEATRRGQFEKGKVAVLINEGSASASEIVAGAIQDNDRGWIVGRRSFGKGLVQEEMTLADGSKIRLTTRRYYTPSGRSIQKPFEEYDQNYLEKSGFDGAGLSQDSLQKNVYRSLGGRILEGGGGIVPDIEVPRDTSRAAAILYHLSLMANLDQSSFDFVDKNRAELSRYSEQNFIENYTISDALLREFFGRNTERLLQQNEETQNLIKARVKSFIGYNLFGNTALIKIYAPFDPTVQKAVESFEKEVVGN